MTTNVGIFRRPPVPGAKRVYRTFDGPEQYRLVEMTDDSPNREKECFRKKKGFKLKFTAVCKTNETRNENQVLL